MKTLIITLALSLALSIPALAGKSGSVVEIGPNGDVNVYDIRKDDYGHTSVYDLNRDKLWYETAPTNDSGSSDRRHDRDSNLPGINVYGDDD